MLLPDRVAAKRERHRLENEPLARWDDGERKGIDRRAAALDMIEARKRGSRIRDLVQETRVDDPLRLAQTKQREREVRETAQDFTAIRSDESSQRRQMSAALACRIASPMLGRSRPARTAARRGEK